MYEQFRGDAEELARHYWGSKVGYAKVFADHIELPPQASGGVTDESLIRIYLAPANAYNRITFGVGKEFFKNYCVGLG